MKEKIKGDFIFWQGLLLHHNCIYHLGSFVRVAFARQPILPEEADMRTISWCQTPTYSKGYFLGRFGNGMYISPMRQHIASETK